MTVNGSHTPEPGLLWRLAAPLIAFGLGCAAADAAPATQTGLAVLGICVAALAGIRLAVGRRALDVPPTPQERQTEIASEMASSDGEPGATSQDEQVTRPPTADEIAAQGAPGHSHATSPSVDVPTPTDEVPQASMAAGENANSFSITKLNSLDGMQARELAVVPPAGAEASLEDSRDHGSTGLRFDELSHKLIDSRHPIRRLRSFVRDIQRRAGEGITPPSGLERFAAQVLDEAGIFDLGEGFPTVDVICPRTSRMLYIRTWNMEGVSYPAAQQVIRLEAALNAIRFAHSSLPADASVEDAYRLNQALARSITAQASPIDDPPELPQDITPDGEYAVRYGISQAIETMQLPYRLCARYRTNVADGNVAIEFDMTPAEVFLASQLVDGLGVVRASGDMRQRAAADYALRVGLLLAANAFRCSSSIRHVWVAAVVDTPQHHSCYYSVDFDRWRFAKLDLEHPGDLAEAFRGFAANVRYEDGWLRPVRQGFRLDEERFCPVRRFQPVSLSSRRLEGAAAERLGCDHVSGLAIEEGDGRAAMAATIALRMAAQDDERATQKNVRMIMDLAGNDPDPTVREAAERVVSRLVSGELQSDPVAVEEEFVRGDILTRTNDQAKQAFMDRNPELAARLLTPVLRQVDELGLYADSPTVAYRFFNSYVQRALYNRACADAGDARTVLLVPDAYFEAHMMLATADLMLGRAEQAYQHAVRLVELAPFEPHAYLNLAKSLEMLDRDEDAIDQLRSLLEHACEPGGIAVGYYRMAFFQWKQGNLAAAQACYHYAMQMSPSSIPIVAMELAALHMENPDELPQELSQKEAEEALRESGIPVAPTKATQERFVECARASFDAEVFPVARSFAHTMGSFSTDDITVGIIRSIEDAPDRPIGL